MTMVIMRNTSSREPPRRFSELRPTKNDGVEFLRVSRRETLFEFRGAKRAKIHSRHSTLVETARYEIVVEHDARRERAQREDLLEDELLEDVGHQHEYAEAEEQEPRARRRRPDRVVVDVAELLDDLLVARVGGERAQRVLGDARALELRVALAEVEDGRRREPRAVRVALDLGDVAEALDVLREERRDEYKEEHNLQGQDDAVEQHRPDGDLLDPDLRLAVAHDRRLLQQVEDLDAAQHQEPEDGPEVGLPARRLVVAAVLVRDAVALDGPVCKSNIQPDFNVSVFECFDANFLAVLRELDESNRSVQKSAESTSI